MAKLFGNKKLLTMIGGVLLVLFLAYILIPSNLPKPIYVEFVSAESESTTTPDAHSEPAKPQHVESTPAPSNANSSEEHAAMMYFEVGDGIMYDVGPRVVNLLDPVGRRYLKISIVLEFLPPDFKYFQLEEVERTAEREKLVEEIAERKPIIDDILISLLTSRSYEDIYSLEGKNQLRADIMERLNEVLQEPQIVAVYFTDFLIQ